MGRSLAEVVIAKLKLTTNMVAGSIPTYPTDPSDPPVYPSRKEGDGGLGMHNLPPDMKTLLASTKPDLITTGGDGFGAKYHRAEPDMVALRTICAIGRPPHDPKTCRIYKCGMCAATKEE